MSTNKKITELPELTELDLADDDVLAIVDVSAGTTNKVQKSVLASALSGVSVVNATSPIAVDQTTGEVTVSISSTPSFGTVSVSADTTSGSAAKIGYTSAEGVIITGQGTSNDVTIKNDADAEVMGVLTGTTTAAFTGQVTGTGFTGTLDGILGSGTPAAATVTTIAASSLTLTTDLAVADGGTGASTLTDGGILLGSGTGAVTAMAVLTDGQMIVGDGTTDPVAEAGTTLRTSIGVGTGDTPLFTGLSIGALDSTLQRAGVGDLNLEGNLIYRAGGTDVPVTDGGTGASTFTDGGVLLGSGTGAVTAMAVLTDGQMIVGDGTTDPVAESGATLRTSIGVGTGDNLQFTNLTATGAFTSLGIDDNATTNAITVSSDEEVTKPLQPFVLASMSADATNVTGDGTAYTLIYNTEIKDVGANYNNGTGVFTAPVSGVYHMEVVFRLQGLLSGHTYLGVSAVTSNRTRQMIRNDPYAVSNSGGDTVFTTSLDEYMDAGDTVSWQVTVSGSTKVVDIRQVATTSAYTSFRLVG